MLERGWLALAGPFAGAAVAKVRCTPVTGRRHQIRLHLAHSGHAIVGDAAYSDDRDSFRMFLHAARLELQARRFASHRFVTIRASRHERAPALPGLRALDGVARRGEEAATRAQVGPLLSRGPSARERRAARLQQPGAEAAATSASGGASGQAAAAGSPPRAAAASAAGERDLDLDALYPGGWLRVEAAEPASFRRACVASRVDCGSAAREHAASQAGP